MKELFCQLALIFTPLMALTIIALFFKLNEFIDRIKELEDQS